MTDQAPPLSDVTAWLRERLDNCQRLAARKAGTDRAGWLEDAAYFTAALNAVSSLERCREALAPFSRLQIPDRPQGNAGAYSIRHIWIEAARAALSLTKKE